MQTTADEKIDLAEESVKDATLALSEVVIQECWGSHSFNSKVCIVVVMSDSCKFIVERPAVESFPA